MESDASPAPSPAFLSVFREHAGPGGAMSFERFMDLALYDPAVGYYRAPGPRVGRAWGTDFLTAASVGPLFGSLVAAACASLLGGADPRDFTFVEIGPEGRDGGVLRDVAHPFGALRTIVLGEPPDIGGRCVVFSNELLDAQPCRRFRFRPGGWRELGVSVDGADLREVELGPAPSGLADLLPADAPVGAVFDAPLAAVALLERIASGPWTGLLVAADYGRTWPELAFECPEGTVRAYHRHRQSNDLLARPGRQDLTCHVCWDWLAAALGRRGFADPDVESQESFLVRHAGRALESAARADAPPAVKGALMQLIHPAHMGMRFQVLHALRR